MIPPWYVGPRAKAKVRTKARVHEDDDEGEGQVESDSAGVGEGEGEGEGGGEGTSNHPASTILVATSKRKALRADYVCGSGPANLCLNILQLINNWLRAG